jgi:hypothetical protein
MRSLKILPAALALVAIPLTIPATADAQQPTVLTQVVDKIVAQEHEEVQSLRQYAPIVETYIQKTRPDASQGTVPDGDKYFLGRADLAKGVELKPLIGEVGLKHKLFGVFWMEFLPSGFLQMIYPDANDFDRDHYKFAYLRREFLGEVRCLVFDVDPISKSDKGRFVGRIWVEDQGYHIVRFNGAYNGSSKMSYYFNFDSWRTNAGNNQWLPSFIYSAEGNNRAFGSFNAQTRLWGYNLNLGQDRAEQELSQVLVEASTPVKDQIADAGDYSPLQAQRSWGRQAEDNVIAKMERLGLMAPYGDVDKVLETVVNNLEVTNNLDIQPEVRCRVLMTSTLESFTMGHTIVLSRGLIDVLPDEASLAAILAHELGHIVLGHRMDPQFAFTNRLRFDERDTFHHFGLARTPAEEQAANQKAIQLLKGSPYEDQSRSGQLFLQALEDRSKEIPNLISPHLGNKVPTSWTIAAARPAVNADQSDQAGQPVQASAAKLAANVFTALPLGGRIKIEPWNDQLQMLKSKPVGAVAEYEKVPFEITPMLFYLTRQEASSTAGPEAISAKSDTETKPLEQDAK